MGNEVILVLVIVCAASLLAMAISESAKTITLSTTKLEKNQEHC
jgi:hypothetical protein